MTWVLWDILVPLLLAFGLGVILTWQAWRVFPHLFSAGADTEPKDSAIDQREVESAVLGGEAISDGSARPGDVNKKSQHDSESSGALTELEAANITLIEERDRATLALEEQCSETQQLKSRNEELEVLLKERNASAVGPEPDVLDIDPVVSEADDLPEALRLGDMNNNNATIKAEVALLKENVESLSRSLDSERREKREFELQLLNANNRCKKLEGNVTDVPKLESIAADPGRDNKSDDENEAAESQAEVATEVAPGGTAEATAVKSQSVELSVVSIADEFLIEPSPTNTISSKTSASKRPSNPVDAPEGWTIPEVKPSKKERDQLTKIKGVGPVLEKLLHKSGIYFYRQVASLNKNGIDELQAKIPQFPGRIERDNWVDQAKKLHKDKYGVAAS